MVHPDQQYEDYDSVDQAYADMRSEEANAIAENDRRWVSVEDRLPAHYDFYWVIDGRYIVLAYFVPDRWQEADTAGDHEGLHTEYVTGVTHWAELDKPEWPSFMPLPKRSLGNEPGSS